MSNKMREAFERDYKHPDSVHSAIHDFYTDKYGAYLDRESTLYFGFRAAWELQQEEIDALKKQRDELMIAAKELMQSLDYFLSQYLYDTLDDESRKKLEQKELEDIVNLERAIAAARGLIMPALHAAVAE